MQAIMSNGQCRECRGPLMVTAAHVCARPPVDQSWQEKTAVVGRLLLRTIPHINSVVQLRTLVGLLDDCLHAAKAKLASLES